MSIKSDLFELIKKATEEKTSAYDSTAEVVRVDGDTLWVHIAGGVDETPVKKTINAQVGDKVQVRVSGGRAWVQGNETAPPTDDTAANAAQDTADGADRTARTAAAAADKAVAAADAAEAEAGRAKAAADIAQETAESVHDIAVQASEDADAAASAAASAQESADGALVGLSTVQDVVGVLNWITAHGTMTSQSGGTFAEDQVYFVQDNNGDYTVQNVRYSLVPEPKAADIDTYYVLTVDESVQNYVATHIVVDNEGLWLIPETNATPATSSKKILIAVGGSGHTYETAGTYIIGKVNNVDKVLAKFITSGATVGQADGAHSVIDADGQRFYASDGTTQLANIGYGQGASESGTAVAPYYTFGTRESGSSVGNYSVAEGKDSSATAYCSHAEGSSSASQYYAHSEGSGTTASADSSHAEGGGTIANGIASHAEGYSKRSSGTASHAEGWATISGGIASHAEGFNTKATGQAAHAGGNYTIAAKENQTVIGSYNIEDTETTTTKQKAFIIGNGTSSTPRSNAFTVDWEGNTEAAGDITDGSGNVLADKADTSSLSTVATSGSYNDLSHKPTIPTKTSDLTNDSGFTGYPTAKVTNTGTEVAMSGLYVRRKVAVKDNISITASNYADNTTSVSATGYTLLGILGYSISNASTSGTGGMYGYIGQLYATGNSVTYRICNRNSSAIKVKIEMDLLYYKS